MHTYPSIIGIMGILTSIIYIFLLALSIYCIILFVRLGHRGIKALDIYLSKNGYGNNNM